ncbi:hypothetical protein [Chryseobacterium rhizosphaerae]|uniref:hypothetical protein n=1 Tax=Chryseobacterium rhizosphaerae TaxID=395937 RepID=UPI0023587B22|nr:hypothetical protein [Chryseobacterium rhizosphaerae]MDC8101643.1 hypothetical protein [Chryseobacterium rhizosphaerae]
MSIVANGALTGAGTGGVTALIMGQNFLEGIWKGAVIGGGVAAVSYTVNYYANGYNKARYKTTATNSSSSDTTYDINMSREAMQKNITDMRNNNFTPAEINEFGVGADKLGFGGSDGYIYPGDGSKVYAYTTPKNFWTGKSDIVYAPATAQNKEKLAGTMVHETGHAFAQKLGLFDFAINTQNLNIDSRLNTTEHFAIGKLEHVYAQKNLISITRRLISGVYINPDELAIGFYGLNTFSQSLVNRTYEKLLPIFNRFMYYTK